MNFEKLPKKLNKEPFEHTILRNLLSIEIADGMNEEWDSLEWNEPNKNMIEMKKGIKKEITNLNKMGPWTQKAIHCLQSSDFCNYLEKLTGIAGLIPDPHLYGGGLVDTPKGGYLNVHADYNFNNRLKLYRRVNVIYYLNKDWQDEWGGHLELWKDKQGSEIVKIPPVFNSAGLFVVSDIALHGFPNKINCPEDRSRRSINMYYYTVDNGKNQSSQPHKTLWS